MANTAEGMDYTESERYKHIVTCALCALLTVVLLYYILYLYVDHNECNR